MSPASTQNTIKKLIAGVCDIDIGRIRDNGKLLGYGLDSVRVIDLLIALEETYDIELNESDPALARVHTVEDLVALVEQRRAL